MMRPTRQVPMLQDDGSTVLTDRPDWKTISEWVRPQLMLRRSLTALAVMLQLHWDMNPWTGKATTHGFTVRDPEANRGYDYLKTQGMIALVDCGPRDGGFHAVPGIAPVLRQWAHANCALYDPQERSSTVQVPKHDPMRQDIQTIPLRAGSVMVWDSRTPHGTFPNDSPHGRLIQYIRMLRADDPAIVPFCTRDMLPEELPVTELGEKLFGLRDWD